jgi:hypothetical protein
VRVASQDYQVTVWDPGLHSGISVCSSRERAQSDQQNRTQQGMWLSPCSRSSQACSTIVSRSAECGSSSESIPVGEPPVAQLLLKNALQQPDGIETDLGTATWKLRHHLERPGG